MKMTKPINEVVGNESRVEILRALFRYPEGEFTGRHVARLTRLPQATVLRQLNILEDYNIVQSRRFGRSRVFSLNEKHYLFPVLQDLFSRESALASEIRQVVRSSIEHNKSLRKWLVHASLYGSVVEGRESTGSDLDLFLVRRPGASEEKIHDWLVDLGQEVATISGTHLHPYVSSSEELRKINKKLWHNLELHSEHVYGKSFQELERTWLKRSKPKVHR